MHAFRSIVDHTYKHPGTPERVSARLRGLVVLNGLDAIFCTPSFEAPPHSCTTGAVMWPQAGRAGARLGTGRSSQGDAVSSDGS